MPEQIKDNPAKQKKPNKEVRAWMRITQEDKDKLEEVAGKYDLKVSQYLRVVLKNALHQETTLNPQERATPRNNVEP